MLATWSEDAYPPPAPPYLSKVLERTRRTRQRRAWASLERWLPMSVTTDRQAAPGALRLAWILLIVIALVVAAAGIAVVGARLFAPSTGIPQGGDAVLALASLEGELRADRRRLHLQGRWHRPSPGRPAGWPAQSPAVRARKRNVLVARWASHRFPQLVQRQRPDRGHGRRRRQSQGPRDASADRQGLLRPIGACLVTGRSHDPVRRQRLLRWHAHHLCRPVGWVRASARRVRPRNEWHVPDVLAERPSARVRGQ